MKNNHLIKYSLLAIGALIFMVVPGFVSSYQLNSLLMILFYGYLASCWNIVGGYAGQLSLGHALFVGIGAYTSTYLFIQFGLSPWIGMIIGACLATVMGAGLAYLSFHFRIKGPYFALVTLALAQVFLYLVLNIKQLGAASGLIVPTKGNAPLLFQFESRVIYYYIMLGMLILVLIVTATLLRRKVGYYFVAIRENENAAQALGINVMKYKIWVVGLSAFLTALGGSFYAQYFMFIDPASVFGISLSTDIVIFAIIGGVGTLFGPVIGSVVLVTVGDLTRLIFASALTGNSLRSIHIIVYGLFLILVILFMPNGIAGWLRGKKLLGRRNHKDAVVSGEIDKKVWGLNGD